MHSLIISLLVGMPLGALPSDEDFANQPAAKRPQLEVRYTDGSRTAFDLLAACYHLTGELRKPHRLADAGTGEEWLSVTVEGAAGEVYSAQHADSHCASTSTAAGRTSARSTGSTTRSRTNPARLRR